MVVTRKRSCSASEPSTARTETRASKLRKQDDVASPATRTPTRPANPSGTPATPTRRTRRVTDTVVDAAPPSPHPMRTRRSSINTSAQDTKTPVKTMQMSTSSDETDSSSSCGKQLRVTLRDISTPSTPTRRSRRISGGGDVGSLDASGVAGVAKAISSDSVDNARTPTAMKVSTPVRRSRRLSGGGQDDTPSQDTPKQLSFSIARIIGTEMKKAKEDEGMKQSCLPVINEDVEQAEGRSPKKDAKVPAVEEEKIDSAKPDLSQTESETVEKTKPTGEQTVNDSESAVPKLVEDKQSPSPSPKKEAGKGEIIEEQEVDARKCDAQKTTEDTKGEDKGIVELTKSTDDDKQQQQKTTNDSSVKSPKKNSTDKKEHNTSLDITTTNSMKPTSPEDKQKTTPSHEATNQSITKQDTQVTSSGPVDVNANKNLKDTKPVLTPQITPSDKQLLKAIPDLEKKIEQLRSVPKGQPISGRWWKKEKQRFRSINKDASGKKKWSKKMQLKQWREDVMAKSAAIEAEKQKKKEDLKERQKINKIRREENAKKAEIVQVIKDPRKIKKMKRKQLRQIQTRETTNLKQV